MRWTSGVLFGVAVLAFATGCNGPQGDNAGPPGGIPSESAPAAVEGTPVPNGPNVQEALDVANKQFDLLAQGNWVSAWGQWTDSAKKEVPQKDFEKVNQTCPFQKGNLCTAREPRPLGCRVYYCDPAYQGRAAEITEEYLARLKRLADEYGLAWRYAPLQQFLKDPALARLGPDRDLAHTPPTQGEDLA